MFIFIFSLVIKQNVIKQMLMLIDIFVLCKYFIDFFLDEKQKLNSFHFFFRDKIHDAS